MEYTTIPNTQAIPPFIARSLVAKAEDENCYVFLGYEIVNEKCGKFDVRIPASATKDGKARNVASLSSLGSAMTEVLNRNLLTLTQKQCEKLGIIVFPKLPRGTTVKLDDGEVVEFDYTLNAEVYPNGKWQTNCQMRSIGEHPPEDTVYNWSPRGEYRKREVTCQPWSSCRLGKEYLPSVLAQRFTAEDFSKIALEQRKEMGICLYPSVSVGDHIFWTWGDTYVCEMEVLAFKALPLPDRKAKDETPKPTLYAVCRQNELNPVYNEEVLHERFVPIDEYGHVGDGYFLTRKEATERVVKAICRKLDIYLGFASWTSSFNLDADTISVEFCGGVDDDGDAYINLAVLDISGNELRLYREYEDETVPMYLGKGKAPKGYMKNSIPEDKLRAIRLMLYTVAHEFEAERNKG